MARLMELDVPALARQRRGHEAVAELVHRAGRGDQRAWDALVEEFSGLVWAATRAHRLSRADAADAVQNTWLRLVQHLDHVHDPARIGGWLATTARRECLRILRDRSRLCDELPDVVDEAPEHSSDLVLAERDARLWAAFSRLCSRDQALLRMLVADPAPSYQEISAALGMPIGSIGPTRARCLERLRREVERLGLSGEDASDD